MKLSIPRINGKSEKLPCEASSEWREFTNDFRFCGRSSLVKNQTGYAAAAVTDIKIISNLNALGKLINHFSRLEASQLTRRTRPFLP